MWARARVDFFFSLKFCKFETRKITAFSERNTAHAIVGAFRLKSLSSSFFRHTHEVWLCTDNKYAWSAYSSVVYEGKEKCASVVPKYKRIFCYQLKILHEFSHVLTLFPLEAKRATKNRQICRLVLSSDRRCWGLWGKDPSHASTSQAAYLLQQERLYASRSHLQRLSIIWLVTNDNFSQSLSAPICSKQGQTDQSQSFITLVNWVFFLALLEKIYQLTTM